MPALAAVALPKCPLCAAAYLAVLGFGGATASRLAPALVGLRTVAMVVLCALLASRCRGIMTRLARRRSRHGAPRLAGPGPAR